MIDDYPRRHLAFDACFNFRDIGGYPAADGRTVRWGRYYRAGRQDRMTRADLDRAQGLGIATQIDLRKPEEIGEQTRGPLERLGSAYCNIPVIPDGGTDHLARIVGDTGISGRRYLAYLEFGPDTWRRLFALLATQDSAPVVVHCTAGKDRTGVETAFLLSVLGVGRAVIEADYILTNRDVARQVDYLERANALPPGMDRDTLVRLAGVPETAMADFLDGLDEHWGGPLGYLEHIGIAPDTLQAVREVYLEG
jgi:protein tyrosine/serine phosphatase